MKRLLVAAALAVVPAAAHAGMGLTWQAGGTFNSPNGHYINVFGLPTLDFHQQGGMVIQVNAMDLIYGLATKTLDANGDTSRAVDLAGGVYFTTRRYKVSEDIGGVIQPGARLEVQTNTGFDPLAVTAQAQVRMGAQAQKGMGFGIYVVPGIGAGLGQDGEADLIMSAGLQISTWLNAE